MESSSSCTYSAGKGGGGVSCLRAREWILACAGMGMDSSKQFGPGCGRFDFPSEASICEQIEGSIQSGLKAGCFTASRACLYPPWKLLVVFVHIKPKRILDISFFLRF